MPDFPERASRAFAAWRLLNRTRDFPAAGAVIMAHANLSPFEVDLLATVEETMQAAWRKQPPAQAEEGESDER